MDTIVVGLRGASDQVSGKSWEFHLDLWGGRSRAPRRRLAGRHVGPVELEMLGQPSCQRVEVRNASLVASRRWQRRDGNSDWNAADLDDPHLAVQIPARDSRLTPRSPPTLQCRVTGE